MTWSFARPDGRALFRLAEIGGEPVLVWLRVGITTSTQTERVHGNAGSGSMQVGEPSDNHQPWQGAR
jgi:hypothetical protein